MHRSHPEARSKAALPSSSIGRHGDNGALLGIGGDRIFTSSRSAIWRTSISPAVYWTISPMTLRPAILLYIEAVTAARKNHVCRTGGPDRNLSSPSSGAAWGIRRPHRQELAGIDTVYDTTFGRRDPARTNLGKLSTPSSSPSRGSGILRRV
jgi:hypothetical protein